MVSRSTPRPDALAVITVIVLSVVLTIIGYTVAVVNRLATLAVLSSLTGAALLVGGFVGFLFGMPRYVERSSKSRSYRPSTNLEQVADWLTKVLIGIGIAQATTIANGLNSFLDKKVVPTFEGASGGYVVSLSLVLVGIVAGFLLGWIAASFYVSRALSNLDVELARALDAVVEQVAKHDPAAAEDIRNIATEATATDSGASAELFVADVLAELKQYCERRGWQLVSDRIWDSIIIDNQHRRWGVEIRYRTTEVRSGPLRFVGGRIITSRQSVVGALLISNQDFSSIARRELTAFADHDIPIIACTLATKPYRSALMTALDQLAVVEEARSGALNNDAEDEGSERS